MRAVVFLLLAPAIIPASARGDTCKEAFTQSSTLAHDGRLLAARAELRVCASAGCPGAMRAVCVHDLEALDPRVPTVVFAAKDRDTQRDLVDVRVLVDGVLVQDGLDGKAREVDPGLHAFRFERQGTRLGETSVLVREGEKDRVVAIDWRGSVPSAPTLDEKRRPIPLRAWIAGGFTLAAIGVWVTAGVDGFVRESQLDSCKAMGCPRSSIQSTETMFNVADVAGGTAIALGALTTIFILTRPSVTTRTATVTLGGGRLLFSGTF
jgi:hypothetical protein